MDINDQLLLAKGAGYKDARKTHNAIPAGSIAGSAVTEIIECSLHGEIFILNSYETRGKLCENLKISVEWRPEAKNWIVVRYNQYNNPLWNGVCTTQEEISEAINNVALEILRSGK